MKVQIARKKISLPKLFFCELGLGGYQQLIALFNLVKNKNSKDIYLIVQSMKLLLVLSIHVFDTQN